MDYTKVLHNFKLKSTPCRTEVLAVMMQKGYALAHGDIEQQLSATFDRVTVYRTLKSFLDKGLIHKVLDDEGVTKYALCGECTVEEHHHEHVHFKCKNCGHTICLETNIPEIKLPVGYFSHEKNFLIQGICRYCNN